MLAGCFVHCASLLLCASLGPAPTLPPSEPTASEPTVPASPQPADPADPTDPAAPADPTASAASAAEPDPFTAEPAPEPEPEPAPAPAAAPEPTPTAAIADAPPDDSPVVRAKDGNWGLQFTFGGLAPLSIAGVPDHGVNRLLFSELGARRMLANGWAVPFSIGAGVFHHEPDMGAAQNDVGLAASVGIRKYFRVWRRIAPYVGGDLRIHYLDPTGDNNWMVGLGFGPLLGIEYFIGDRVSLLFQGEGLIGIAIFDGLVQVRAATQVAFGGQLGLLFYF